MKKVLFSVPVILVTLLLISMIPFSESSRENLKKIKGLVTDIYLTTNHDIVVKLVDDENHYYIKGASEKGLNYNQVKNALLYQDVEIGYTNQWTLLNNSNNIKSLCTLKLDGQTLYTSVKN